MVRSLDIVYRADDMRHGPEVAVTRLADGRTNSAGRRKFTAVSLWKMSEINSVVAIYRPVPFPRTNLSEHRFCSGEAII